MCGCADDSVLIFGPTRLRPRLVSESVQKTIADAGDARRHASDSSAVLGAATLLSVPLANDAGDSFVGSFAFCFVFFFSFFGPIRSDRIEHGSTNQNSA